MQAISDGSFDIDIDGSTENITGLDLRVVTDLDEVAAAIDAKLSGGDCAANSDDQLVITSKTTGATSLITVVTDPGTGTYVGTILALAAGTGAGAGQVYSRAAFDGYGRTAASQLYHRQRLPHAHC